MPIGKSAEGSALAVLVFAALLAGAAPAAAQKEQTVLAIPSTSMLFLSQHVATDKHLWEQEGLEVKVVQITGIGSMNAVISGSADFSMSSGPSITRAWVRGQKLTALATAIAQSGQDVVLRKDLAEAGHLDPNAPLAERAKLLKGRTMAMTGTAAIPDIVLRVIAKEGGVGPDEMTVTPMQPPEFLAALSRKAIDGFANSPPFVQQAVETGLGVILSDATKGEPTQYAPVSAALLLARAGYCQDHRSICTKMVHGIVAATKYIHEHPEDAFAVMKAHFGTAYSDGVLHSAYEMVKAMTPDPPVTTETELKNGDLLNAAAGFIKPDEELASYAPLIDNEFVK